jgi:hypothetical protein
MEIKELKTRFTGRVIGPEDVAHREPRETPPVSVAARSHTLDLPTEIEQQEDSCCFAGDLVFVVT